MVFFNWEAKRREQEFTKIEHESAIANGAPAFDCQHHKRCIASAERLISFIDGLSEDQRYA